MKYIYKCSECGSADVEMKAWVKPNEENKTPQTISLDKEDCWCNGCEQHVEFELHEIDGNGNEYNNQFVTSYLFL